ncbi:MAG TPA: pilus assembly protein N-terminal domain-containing protein, partial [Phycisphaerae bacterium]|nr:pilus assembly protein N-terminal domain-containing protein [Phycisphaerae bacterium]
MISYISLWSLSALMHGQPSPVGGWSIDGMTRPLRAAWIASVSLPQESGGGALSHEGAADLEDFGNCGRLVVMANSGMVSLADFEEDGRFAGEMSDEPLDAASSADSLSDGMQGTDDPGCISLDDEPLALYDIEMSFDEETAPPDESEDEADEPSSDEDLRDFGNALQIRPSAPPVVRTSTPQADSAGLSTVAQEMPVAPVAPIPPEPPANGLSAELREGIQISRMTLKDQPSELIRVSVNSSMVVDLSGPADGANIVDPNIADIIVPSPNRVIVIGKSAGTTQLVLTIGQEHRVFHVYVEPNLVVLTDLIRSLSPRSDVRVGSLNGQLVIQGTVPDTNTAKQVEDLAKAYQGRDVINHLMVSGTQQTLLRVVVAEVNKEALRNLGFNWAIGAQDWSRDFFFANNVAQLNPTTFSSSGLANVLEGQQLYSVAPVANGPNTNISFGFPKAELQVFMNALRQNGLARMLAEPNLVAISGQTATFLAGGEVPIPVSQGGAVAGAITIEYKEFGVRLAFTPTVGADQIIRLHVMSEVSDAVPGSRQIDTIPVFTFRTRRVESTIECPNGKTFAIAGLLNESVNAIANKIPGLGDVPVLGQLFS